MAPVKVTCGVNSCSRETKEKQRYLFHRKSDKGLKGTGVNRSVQVDLKLG